MDERGQLVMDDEDGPLVAPAAFESWIEEHKAALTAQLIEDFGWGLGEARKADRAYAEKLIEKLSRKIDRLAARVRELEGKR
jgi:hypothetical protein